MDALWLIKRMEMEADECYHVQENKEINSILVQVKENEHDDTQLMASNSREQVWICPPDYKVQEAECALDQFKFVLAEFILSKLVKMNGYSAKVSS